MSMTNAQTKLASLTLLTSTSCLLFHCTSGLPPDPVESTGAFLTATTVEAESLPRSSSAAGTSVVTNECAASNCAYVQLAGTPAVNSYIEFTLSGIPAGSYGIAMYFKTNTNRGINRASLDGATIGTACDEYASTMKYQVACSFGTATLATGDHRLRFTVTGKNASSTGYTMTIDKIVLTPSTSGTGGASGTGGQAGGSTGGQGGSPVGGSTGVGGTAGATGGVVIDSVNFVNFSQAGYVSPRNSAAITGSRWGINFHVPSPLGTSVDEIAGTGAKWVRIWMDPAVFDGGGSALYDDLFTRLASLRITPFVTVPNETPGVTTWKTRLTAIINRYKSMVQYWEIFNEPNYGIAATTYVSYVKAGYQTIKALQPTAKVIAGVVAHVDTSYFQSMLNAGAGPFMDIFTFHPYNTLPEYEKSEATTYPQLKSMAASAQPPIVLWQGECGYPSTSTSEGWHREGPWSERVQAKWLTRRFLTDLGENLPVAVYYELRDATYSGKTSTFGLRNLTTWTAKLGYYSMASITSILDNRFSTPKTAQKSFSISNSGSYSGQTASSIKVVAATGTQGDLVAYWLPGVLLDASTVAQAKLTLSNANLTDPVLVDLLDGRVFNVPVTTDATGAMVFANLPLADYAFAIVSRAAVSVQTSKPSL
jgi:hypothetical protein